MRALASRIDEISIHALRGEGDGFGEVTEFEIIISIHALRGEGDGVAHPLTANPHYFNPRPPWGGRQEPGSIPREACNISIHALRGEGDSRQSSDSCGLQYFNPRPPWGGRQRFILKSPSLLGFQSTPSVGRATQIADEMIKNCRISIHALRGEGDENRDDTGHHPVYFNPRPPWGGRRWARVNSAKA